MVERERSELVGKIIGVKYGNVSRKDFAYIEVQGFEVQAGREFLVGSTIARPNEDVDGLRFCVAWEAVNSYYVFDSVQACHDCIHSWYPSRQKSRFWPW